MDEEQNDVRSTNLRPPVYVYVGQSCADWYSVGSCYLVLLTLEPTPKIRILFSSLKSERQTWDR
ncbi:hypothetical protein BD779DRAFT_1530866 [Infundibulicybe gibba]|nr:hypothetical protein BD779DRAFT_1530866 [Infundibulicybe gibba]